MESKRSARTGADSFLENDIRFMRRALELAEKGEGFVEPNPMVGAVLVRDGRIVGEGYHTRYGAPHAEVEAVRDALSRGDGVSGTTCYVTLEPCSHHGKTPPCTSKIIESGIKRVVTAMRDPNPIVDGRGLKLLREAGIDVTEGVLGAESRRLNAPYLTRILKRRPWIIAKWAMTLDGKLASRNGDSRWISCDASRRIVHRLRARMDGIMVGSETVIRDDCLLTARPDREETGVPDRTPCRIVLDGRCRIPLESRLVRTAADFPTLVVVGPEADPVKTGQLQEAGCNLFSCSRQQHFADLFEHLADRGMTNLLVEGGSRVFGALFDAALVDEVHAFIAPKLIGGDAASSPIGGSGLMQMQEAMRLEQLQIETVRQDVYLRGRVIR